jgi:hypothetical protein
MAPDRLAYARAWTDARMCNDLRRAVAMRHTWRAIGRPDLVRLPIERLHAFRRGAWEGLAAFDAGVHELAAAGRIAHALRVLGPLWTWRA